VRWNSEKYDQLEHAGRSGLRVIVQRRGTEYIVIADRVANGPRGEAFHARLPMTGEMMEFLLKDIEWFQVLRNDG
jgi:uncharacterized protein with PhoU and TrkA domain